MEENLESRYGEKDAIEDGENKKEDSSDSSKGEAQIDGRPTEVHGVLEEESENDQQETPTSSPADGLSVVVHNFTASAGKRTVTIHWSVTSKDADSCMVELFENKKNDPCDEFSTEDLTITTHTFIDLKSSTNYFCKLYHFTKKERGNATKSNDVRTEKKDPFPLENDQERFGKATNIFHEFTSDDEVVLSWQPPIVGPNFKIIHYDIKLVKKVKLRKDKPLLDIKLKPNHLNTSSKKISNGSKYAFTIITWFQNLDDNENRNNTATFSFTKKPSPTTINKECVCKNGLVTFMWKPVKGATNYEFEVMDQDQLEYLVPKKTTKVSRDHDGCSIELQSNDKLRIGRYCVTKVTVCMDNEKSPPISQIHIIGGKKVVKNVTAIQNKADPYRSVEIDFDRPDEAAAHQYKVVATSSDGKKKIEIVESTHLTFPYLKKGFLYYFEVFAKWGDEWSEGSRSNYVETAGNVETTLFNIGKMSSSTVAFHGSNVQGNTSLNVYNTNKGEVSNLYHTSVKEYGKDSVTLT